MPDTGAPWNIPYVEATDLVRDWPTDSEALADAIADGLDAAGNAGIGSNVVSTLKTDSFSTTSSSLVEVTGLTATITPSSATSKVLVIYSLVLGASVVGVNAIRLLRDSTGIADCDNTLSGSLTGLNNLVGTTGMNNYSTGQSYVVLDSPATTSAITYSVKISTSAGTGYVNRSGTSGDDTNVSSVTAIEVAV